MTAPASEVIDVNTEDDFRLAELIVAGIHMEEVNRLRLLSQFLSSSVLSDVCDDLGLDAVLGCSYRSLDPTARLFGRARTLSLAKREPEDPPSAIYEALESYRTVISNDVLMVHTDVPEFAYFGELNTSLAVRGSRRRRHRRRDARHGRRARPRVPRVLQGELLPRRQTSRQSPLH